jgi:hypothetical protein
MLPNELDWAKFIARREEALRLLKAGLAGDAKRAPPGLTAAMASTLATHDLLIAVGRPDLAQVDYSMLQNMRDPVGGAVASDVHPEVQGEGL